MNFLFDGQGVEFSDLVGMRSLRVQQQILENVSGNGSAQVQAWEGWLSRVQQMECVKELYPDGVKYFLYPVEEGREQEDIVLQCLRSSIAGGQPSRLSMTSAYLASAALLGCPSCGNDLNFGMYRRCWHCHANLKYVIRCCMCNHFRVGVDCRIFAERMKCEGCGQELRKIQKPPATDKTSAFCSQCKTAISNPPHSSGKCRRCRKGGG